MQVWKYILQQHKWFSGKITTSMAKGVIHNLKKYLSEAQRKILMGTCFAHFLDCHDIVLQPQLIHYFLLRQVHAPNEDELWFCISGRFVRFSMVEFCLVTGLRCTGNTDISTLENSHSMLKEKYFSQLNIVTHEDVRDAFILACQLTEQDVVELLVDEDVAKLGALYFITSYMFPRDYKKVVDHYLFVVVEDFSVIDSFPWGKILFETTPNDMREGLSKRTSHYRPRGLLLPFQVWIYETIPCLAGNIVTRMPVSQPRILNRKADEKPSMAKLEECFANPDIQICDLDPLDNEMHMPYMTGVQYIKPVQPSVSRDGGRKKRRMERSMAGTCGGSGGPRGKLSTTVLTITDGRSDAPIVNEGDDDFADTPPMWQETHAYVHFPVAESP